MSDSNKKTENLESEGKQPVSITNINITDSVVNRSEIGKKINTNSSASGKGKSNIIKQISRKLAGTLGFVLCAVGILGFLVAAFAIDYIDGELEKECEGVKGDIVQGVGLDEGQCDEGSATRDLLAAIQYPLLIAGVLCGLFASKII